MRSARWLWFVVISLLLLLPAITSAASFPHFEASFDLPNLAGNPFDFTQNNVQATIEGPAGNKISVPAFFDGNSTWRVRFTSDSPGKYTISTITLNGQDAHPQKLDQKEFNAAGPSSPGFIRIAPDHHRFIHDDGSPFYPVGYNLAWRTAGGAMPPITDSLARMGAADVNWTRIWMSYWDGKNLDWAVHPADQPLVGELSLPVAQLWDQIVTAADSNHVYFQLVLQHHGQFSSSNDSNWPRHPWNKSNGGWLESAADFFTDPKAIALTRAKYRYIIARWGYSPSIMAWELFNEVESTDGFKTNLDAVAKWHTDMAGFLREQDPYHHLITTSSWTTEPKLWPAMAYYQPHVYPPDILSSIVNLDVQHLDRPYFYGEISAIAGSDDSADDTIHRALWASLMSRSSGSAQYWSWDIVEPKNLLPRFTAVQEFIRESGMLTRTDLKPIDINPETAERGPLRFGPALGWARSTGTNFIARRDGVVEGIGQMSAFLQGVGKNHDMFPFASFDVDYPAAGTFAVRVDQVASKGAKLALSVDAQPITMLDLAKDPDESNHDRQLDATLEIPVPAGKHSIRMENLGPDWLRIREFTLSPYAPKLGVLAKGNNDFAIAWIYHRAPISNPIAGTLQIPGLDPGDYNITWWNTDEGKIAMREKFTIVAGITPSLATPSITRHLALWITRTRATK